MAPAAPPYPAHSHAWFMMLIAAVLFIIGAFAFGGDALGDIPGWAWDSAAAAAFVLAWVVP